MSNVKLTYFNGRGLAETTRFLLKYGNIDFEDNRFGQDDWPTIKPTTPFGQVPIYEENGKVAWQSLAIARYVAKKVKLVGDNDWENLEIDAMVDTVNDLRLKIAQAHYESDAEKKATIKQTLKSETIPYFLEKMDKIAAENNGHLAVNKLTWADFYFSTVADMFNLIMGEDVLEKYSNLASMRNKVREIPAIKAWIEARPETAF